MSEGRERANQREEGGGGVSLAFYTEREREEGERRSSMWSGVVGGLAGHGKRGRSKREKKAEKEKKNESSRLIWGFKTQIMLQVLNLIFMFLWS